MTGKCKPTVRVLADKWAIVRAETAVALCVWRTCERKATDANATQSTDDRPITPFNILAWEGQWSLGDQTRGIRPVEGCECVLCEERRRDGAR